jgi:hypothetical protein
MLREPMIRYVEPRDEIQRGMKRGIEASTVLLSRLHGGGGAALVFLGASGETAGNRGRGNKTVDHRVEPIALFETWVASAGFPLVFWVCGEQGSRRDGHRTVL